MVICKFFQQGHCRKGFDCDFEHIRDGKNATSFISNSRDNIQQNSPPRRKSNRFNKKPTGGSSNDNLQVKKLHGQTHENKPEGAKKGKKNNDKNNKNKKKKSNSFTKLPSYRPPNYQPEKTTAPPTVPRVLGIKDYVDMVMTDLSTRPPLWHFSSYGLSLNSTQSLPFPHFGTVELSAEELRLQVYAEAAATGGRIDNYVKVVGEIKVKAEAVTKSLIPNLERVISETLRDNNISLGAYQENVQQASQANYSAPQLNYSTTYNPSVSQASYNVANYNQISQQEPPLIQHPTIQYQPQYQQQQPHQSNEIIPDDSFSFGMIPEIPPE